MPDGAPSSPPAPLVPGSLAPRYGSPFSLAIAAGGIRLRVLGMPHITPLEGGMLLMRDAEIAGAIGVSGMQSSQDAQVAQAGADAPAR